MADYVGKIVGVSVGLSVLILFLIGLIWPLIQEATGSSSTLPDTWQTMLPILGLMLIVGGIVFVARSVISGRD